MAFVEDLAPFFSADGFAVSALWNGTTTVKGILQAPYADAFVEIVEGSEPFFLCAAASVAGVKHGDTLVINAITYKVRGVQPDGTGVVSLRVEEQ
jgi:hypothetical protein